VGRSELSWHVYRAIRCFKTLPRAHLRVRRGSADPLGAAAAPVTFAWLIRAWRWITGSIGFCRKQRDGNSLQLSNSSHVPHRHHQPLCGASGAGHGAPRDRLSIPVCHKAHSGGRPTGPVGHRARYRGRKPVVNHHEICARASIVHRINRRTRITTKLTHQAHHGAVTHHGSHRHCLGSRLRVTGYPELDIFRTVPCTISERDGGGRGD
jgi:hypothetical protein